MSKPDDFHIQGMTESGKIRAGGSMTESQKLRLTESQKIRAGIPNPPVQPARPIDTSDHINISDEALEESAPVPSVTAPSAPASGLGIPGIGNGGVINSSQGLSGFGAPGIHSGGVIVSGRQPDTMVLPGSAGKVFS